MMPISWSVAQSITRSPGSSWSKNCPWGRWTSVRRMDTVFPFQSQGCVHVVHAG
ncbi:MAG: hypothetical protein ACLSHM_01670 [Vescimonas sp.]